MRYKQFAMMILGWIAVQTASAADVPFKLPPPKCFQKFTLETPQPLNLTTDPCLQYREDYNDYALKQGFTGYELASDEPVMRPVSIYYKFIAPLADHSNDFVFLLQWSGGGTGFFSSLVILNHQNNILKLKQTLAGGDRCFGSIDKAWVKHNQVFYQQKVTPYQFMAERFPKLSQLNALEDCAVCCLGVFNRTKNTIDSFSLSNVPADDGSTVQQRCMNNIIKQAATSKQTFDRQQLKKLQLQIKSACLSGNKND
jgi:hypothetical protein